MAGPHHSRAGHGHQRRPLPACHPAQPLGRAGFTPADSLHRSSLQLRSQQRLLLLLTLLQLSTLLLVIAGPTPPRLRPVHHTAFSPMPTPPPPLPLPLQELR